MSSYENLSNIDTAALYRLSAASAPMSGTEIYQMIAARTDIRFRESAVYQSLRRLNQRNYVRASQRPKNATSGAGDSTVTAYAITDLGRAALEKARKIHLELSDDLTVKRRRSKTGRA